MTFRTLLFTLALLPCLISTARAQHPSPKQDSPSAGRSDLPEAPVPAVSDAQQSTPSHPAYKHRTGPYDTLIDTTEIAPHLTASNKVGMGIKASVSPFAVLGWVGSATYGEAFDRSPNYGQDGKAYLQRIGAASAKASSETIFTISVLAPALHEDPRYYILGPGHNGFRRTGHALSSIFFTRTDRGGRSVNYALLGGNLAGSALTHAYYPAENRGATEVLTTFGTSLGGSAIKDLFDEFLSNAAAVTQLKRKLPL